MLLDGVTEGRKTFANLMKYIKMATSFNFGEVLSVIVASVALPFLPETPIQLLVESLLYDFGQMTLPFDNVDNDIIKKPKTFSIKSLKNFMLFMGPLSSIFDLVVFASLWFIFGIREAATFQTVWFSYSIVSNLVGMHIIRTSKIPFIQSNAHKMVYFSSILLIIIGLIVPFTTLGSIIGLVPIAFKYIVMIFVITFFYCILALLSSIFDLVVFASLWFIFGIREAATFQTVWFSYSIVSNLVGMHIIRTSKIPFIQSNAHKMVYFSSILLIIIGLIVPFTTLGSIIGLVPIAFKYIVMIFVITFFYCILALFAKKIYIKKYGDWI